jgi:DNA-directed RNA polymerase specialized sigma24 family protein
VDQSSRPGGALRGEPGPPAGGGLPDARPEAEADDAVQESRLRLSLAGASGVLNLRAWLTTVVARECLDMLRSRAAWRDAGTVGAERAGGR